ncbi:MAG: ribonuclease H-like domain-containing protein [Armatimonadota bacterium]
MDRPDEPFRNDSAQQPPSSPSIALEDAVPGAEVVSPTGGRAYLVETNLIELSDAADELLSALESTLEHRNLKDPSTGRIIRPEHIIVLDLETTGLIGNVPLFLAGTLVSELRSLTIRQFLARNYNEEPAVVSLLFREVAEKRLLISFNGERFDLPFVLSRAAALGIEPPEIPKHLDLLPLSRRRWGAYLPNCKLRTIETAVCGRRRSGDIPSHLIPDAYKRFLRTGDASEMAVILRHNAWDIITTLELFLRLMGPA